MTREARSSQMSSMIEDLVDSLNRVHRVLLAATFIELVLVVVLPVKEGVLPETLQLLLKFGLFLTISVVIPSSILLSFVTWFVSREMKNFGWSLLIIGMTVAATLMSVDLANALLTF